MPDDPAFIGLKRGFTFCIQCGRDRRRIGPAFCNGIAEELENIVVVAPSLESACGILNLSCSIEMQAAAAEDDQGSYQDMLHQALMVKQV
jgi:hypothetical protein